MPESEKEKEIKSATVVWKWATRALSVLGGVLGRSAHEVDVPFDGAKAEALTKSVKDILHRTLGARAHLWMTGADFGSRICTFNISAEASLAGWSCLIAFLAPDPAVRPKVRKWSD